MKGLEISEINLSDLENQKTIGAEYYAPTFLNSFSRITNSKIPKKSLSDCCSLITDGDHGSADYQDTGVPFILSEAVNEGWLSSEKFRFISKTHSETLKRSELTPGNVLLTKTGIYFGKSAVMPDTVPVANTIAHVAKLVVEDFINPYYLSTFFNSIYGYLQLRRRGIKATRPEMKLVEMQDIIIPIPSTIFQSAIEKTVKEGIEVNQKQEYLYQEAERLLLNALNLSNWEPHIPVSHEESASKAFNIGRFDAEYYQPEYQALLDHVNKYAVRVRQVGEFAIKCERGSLPIYDEEGEFFALTSKHILENGLDYENFERTSSIDLNAKVEMYDVLTYMTGANVGRTAVLLENVTAQVSGDVNILRMDEENPLYVAVVLNSMIGRKQTYRTVTGSAQVHLYSNDIVNFNIPFVTKEVEHEITKCVEAAYIASKQAKQLLFLAKRAVEIVIEEGEEKGLDYLNKNKNA